MNEERVSFKSGDLTLEGLLARPVVSEPVHGGVVCHPHPLYGGSMHNNVVDAVLRAMWELGWATLRFNFRGVGASQGEHAGGPGEADDTRAAVEFLRAQPGVASAGVILAGYSFGALAALAAGPQLEGLAALALIALPLQMADTAALARFHQPIILAAGDRDGYCPAQRLEALHRVLGPRSQIRLIEGADHFFGGFEQALADALKEMLRAITTTT